MRLIHDLASAALARLDPDARAPIAVAVSGGADSLAALIVTVDWAKRHGRPVLALSVDHRLQPQSGAWTTQAGEAGRQLGASFQAMSWDAARPATGLPAAARTARHRLLAEAARAAGCAVLVTGHTLDDVRENALMGLGPILEWSPSPVWPEGRDLFLFRPLLSARRDVLRQALAEAGWSWIDDPANDDPAHPRTRARRLVQEGAAPQAALLADAAGSARSAAFQAGMIVIPRSSIASTGFAAARRTIGAAAVCAGGAVAPPRGASLDRLTERLQSGQRFRASLAGARIEAGDDVRFVREAGEKARGGLAPLAMGAGSLAVWDGRFEVEALGKDIEVRALAGSFRRLSAAERRALAGLPAALRPALPAILDQAGELSCPILAPASHVRVRSLVEGRFQGVCGVFLNERAACDAVRVAKWDPEAYLGMQVRLAAEWNNDLGPVSDLVGTSGASGERGEIYEPA